MDIKPVIGIVLTMIFSSKSAKILGIVSLPSYSHQVAFHPLWRELSLRGHQVTTFTTDIMDDPKLVNLTEIDLHFSYEVWNANLLEVIDRYQQNAFTFLPIVLHIMDKVSEIQLEHCGVQEILNGQDEKFDVVISEYFTPVMFAFAEKFDCPLIGLVSMDAPTSVMKLVGNPTHPILYPDNMLSFTDKLTLSERIRSVLYSVVFEIYTNYYFYSLQQKQVERFFGSNYSSVREIAHNVSMLFINTDPVFHKVRPYLPNIVQIGGGRHRTPSKPLPKELKMVLDNATEGVIYFSLGTNVKSKDISVDVRSLILSVFAELPYTILWKFEAEDLPNKPKNVIVSNWFPQKDLFKHPNIKLFITQGGIQSMEEAIYDRIPMIAIPFVADQYHNVQRMVQRGFGLSINYATLEKNKFKDAILEVINNPKYIKKITELAELAADLPMTGLEKAIWWTEYVIRHKGAKHFRSPLLDIPSYQYYLLDVVTIFLLFLAILLYVIFTIFKFILVLVQLCSRDKSKMKAQ